MEKIKKRKKMQGNGWGVGERKNTWEGGRTEERRKEKEAVWEQCRKGKEEVLKQWRKGERGSSRGLVEGGGWKSEEMEIGEEGKSSSGMDKGEGGITIEMEEEEGINTLWRGKREKRWGWVGR
jgi:hypothetical protein